MGVFNYLKKLAKSAASAASWSASGSESPADVLDGFIHFGQVLPVNSSNVTAAQYDIETDTIIVEFHGGDNRSDFYQYSGVSEAEARDFAVASSPGGWVWDHLRVRGSATAHRKPYSRVDGFN